LAARGAPLRLRHAGAAVQLTPTTLVQSENATQTISGIEGRDAADIAKALVTA